MLKRKIRASFKRCVKRGLAKEILSPSVILNQQDITNLLADTEMLISIFESCITNIKQSLTGQFLFLLTDSNGVLIAIDYSDEIEVLVNSVDLQIGMSFAEESCGTNAISMAIEMKDHVYLKPEQHYCEFLKKWYCYATPLFLDNKVIGYLDVSTINETMKKELVAITELLPYRMMHDHKNMMNKQKEYILLSKQQLQVLTLVAKGHTARAISNKLNITISAVKFHKTNVFRKLGVQSAPEAIAKAVEYGMELNV